MLMMLIMLVSGLSWSAREPLPPPVQPRAPEIIYVEPLPSPTPSIELTFDWGFYEPPTPTPTPDVYGDEYPWPTEEDWGDDPMQICHYSRWDVEHNDRTGGSRVVVPTGTANRHLRQHMLDYRLRPGNTCD